MPRWQDHEEYFWSLVKKLPGDACWEWTGDFSKGYGRIWKDGRRTGAHRVAYEYTNGPIPYGLLACHHCDNRKCVRPDHLFLGTQKDNMRDWTKKGKNILINHPELMKRGDDHWLRQNDARAKKWKKKMSQRQIARHRNGIISPIKLPSGKIMGSKVL
jgi:HNH endonuclease